MTKDKTTVAGLAIVGLAAAVLTFTTLRSLALACGFSEGLSWLVPLTVDAAGLVALRIWLRDALGSAKKLTMVCIGLSIAGNATQHGLAAYRLPVPWWVIVVVSAAPPSMLAAVVHLAHQAGRLDTAKPLRPHQDEQPAPPAAEPDEPEAIDAPAPPAEQSSEPDSTPTALHLAPPPPSNGKPWSPRAQQYIREGMKDSTAYTKAKREWHRDNPGRTA